MWVVGIFQSKAAALGVCLWEEGTSSGPPAEMRYPGDVWRTALRMPPPFVE